MGWTQSILNSVIFDELRDMPKPMLSRLWCFGWFLLQLLVACDLSCYSRAWSRWVGCAGKKITEVCLKVLRGIYQCCLVPSAPVASTCTSRTEPSPDGSSSVLSVSHWRAVCVTSSASAALFLCISLTDYMVCIWERLSELNLRLSTVWLCFLYNMTAMRYDTIIWYQLLWRPAWWSVSSHPLRCWPPMYLEGILKVSDWSSACCPESWTTCNCWIAWLSL